MWVWDQSCSSVASVRTRREQQKPVQQQHREQLLTLSPTPRAQRAQVLPAPLPILSLLSQRRSLAQLHRSQVTRQEGGACDGRLCGEGLVHVRTAAAGQHTASAGILLRIHRSYALLCHPQQRVEPTQLGPRSALAAQTPRADCLGCVHACRTPSTSPFLSVT